MASIDSSQKVALPPTTEGKIRAEIEQYGRLIREMERRGGSKEQTSLLWMEIATRKDLYRVLTGETYEPPLDASRNDKVPLTKLFQALSGYSWARNEGWVGQEKTLLRPAIGIFEAEASLFDGVTISKFGTGKFLQTNTSALDFTGNGLDGSLPGSIGEVGGLKHLVLRHNLISGGLPASIRMLDNLHTLNLSSNLLSGQLETDVFENFQKLLVLDLSFNKFSGNIPPNFFSTMKKIVTLNLAGNNFTGALPDSICLMTELQTIQVQNNDFTGAIPSEMSELVQLREANLSCNKFTSGLGAFSGCERLTRLQLNNNQIDNHFDPHLSELAMLDLLYLQNNHIRGYIPPEIGNLRNLRFFNASNNKLFGQLPKEIAQCTKLQALLLSGNDLTGPVPISIAALTNLRDLTLFSCIPAENSETKRQLRPRRFANLYVTSQILRLNSNIYDEKHLYGEDRASFETSSVKSFYDNFHHHIKGKHGAAGEDGDDNATLMTHNSVNSYLSTEKAVAKDVISFMHK